MAKIDQTWAFPPHFENFLATFESQAECTQMFAIQLQYLSFNKDTLHAKPVAKLRRFVGTLVTRCADLPHTFLTGKFQNRQHVAQ